MKICASQIQLSGRAVSPLTAVVGAQGTARPTRHSSGFTMVEIAICLAVIGIALVAIIGVLPIGMNTQRDNREETLINQDATVLMEAIRSGARGLDDLTNYVYAITNYGGQYKNGVPTLYSSPAPGCTNYPGFLTNGMNIVGLLSTPEFTDPNNSNAPIENPALFNVYNSNHIVAYVRSISGPAIEKPPQNNDIVVGDSFGYRVLCVNAPVAMDTPPIWQPVIQRGTVSRNLLAGNRKHPGGMPPAVSMGEDSLQQRTRRQSARVAADVSLAATAQRQTGAGPPDLSHVGRRKSGPIFQQNQFVFLPVAIVHQRHQRAMNLKFPISYASGRAVSPLTAARSQAGVGAHGVTRPTDSLVTRHPSPATRHAFTLIEVLVVVVLMSLIVLALMAVFSSTQSAFRASITQTDVLEGGRSAMGMIKNDLESMTPSFGTNYGAVNFCVVTNYWQYSSSNAVSLVQSFSGSSQQRTNVLEYFFILTRQNMEWTGTGYVVDTTSSNYFNPLYRFSMSTNVMAANPAVLFNIFFTNLPAYTGLPISPANPSMSHLLDGVMHLTARAYDPNGYWMTNTPEIYGVPPITNRYGNVWFSPPLLGEVGFYMYSNTLPASVQIELGILEDRTIQRAESLSGAAQLNYLSNHVGQVHLFRQRFPIRNVDPAAYQ